MPAKDSAWTGEGALASVVRAQSDENLRVYVTSATRVDEDAGQEMNLAHGGYGKRQLLELIQNGADAILPAPGGRIHVVLTAEYLYCANEGETIDEDGIRALLHAHISRKRDAEIGRFGLGFKSVLGVTDRPEFYCRQASFGFDAEWAKAQISEIAPDRERYPALRLARVLDASAAATGDPELSALMEWATTVVRLPRSRGTSDWLSVDIADFDPAFLLFSPHVGELLLEDRTTGDVRREIRLSAVGDEVTIREGTDLRRWRVFKTTIRPSSEAKHDAWELSAREELPLGWALPIEGRLTVGRFWAFFPLRDETTLTGIANAPWQINDDRTGLLEGSQLNKELIEGLTELVLHSLSSLVKDDDPGWILDVIPARGREARCWGDELLSARFYELAADWPVIPDQDGKLTTAVNLRLPPNAASRHALDKWASSPGRPADWCHASAVAATTRRSRVDRLFEIVKKSEESVPNWLEALVPATPSFGDVHNAILTAATFIGDGDDPGGLSSRKLMVQRSRIVLDSTPLLTVPKPGEIFIPPQEERPGSTLVRLVHAEVIARTEMREALETIGLEEVTPALELKAFIHRQLRTGDWETLWELVRRLSDVDEAVNILGQIHGNGVAVRTVEGSYRALSQTLLPGPVVPADGSRDKSVAIDIVYHRSELEVLRRLGAEQTPTDGYPISKDAVVNSYRNLCIRSYIDGLPEGSQTPAWDYMEFDRKTHVGPLEPLLHLSDEGRAAFTEELIRASNDWRPWMLKHSTQRGYPPREFPPATVWAIKKEGRLTSSRGVVPVSHAWGQAFQPWAEIVPVVSLSDDTSARVGVPVQTEELPTTHWRRAFSDALQSTDDSLLGNFYVWAARSGVPAPDEVRCRVGATHAECPPSAVVVTHSHEAFAALRELERPCLLVSRPDDATHLIDRWQLIASSAHVRQERHWVENGPAAPLADLFPTLRADLEAAGWAHIEFVPCEEIYETIATEAGTADVPKEMEVVGDRLLWRTDLGLEEALRRLAGLLPFPVSDEEISDLAEGRWKQDRRERLASIRDQKTNEERLLAALGEDRLRARLPIGLLDAVSEIHGALAPSDVARLMLVVHGDDALQYLRDDLRDAGLHPPDRWAGSREARSFVRDLGFPEEFAGAPSVRREPELVVLGPPDLPPLHDYQTKIVAQIDELIARREDHPRGLVSLPTGAGKTRVSVEALVQAITSGRLASPVLWIAQSDELCEQAVQTWSEVWRAIGTMDELRIGRLWGPSNEVPESVDSAQVVVATIDKLRHRVDAPEYGWLAETSCVVIDEAHGAITPEYTRVLRWLGISAAGRTMATRVPLLGLTATPFRGTSADETDRLVKRFGGRRLDRVFGVDDDYEATYRELQRMGVLSKVDGEELESGTMVDIARDLSSDEKSAFSQRLDLPNRVFDRIAKDVDRNRLLLESIVKRPNDWPILLFAVSTEHAHTMAALLTLEGVSAAAIDYRTDHSVRRRYIDRFRRGELRVLANFNVLTQGFDAPAVRAIYVARPTFSPNNYQQMIGRGLRGPLNRGKERCLIVNVRDNWTMYGEQLAFYEFEHLWKPDEA